VAGHLTTKPEVWGSNPADHAYHTKSGFRVARVGPSVALALLDVAHEVDDGHARHEVLLVPAVEASSRILARLGLKFGGTVAKFDACGRPQSHRPRRRF